MDRSAKNPELLKIYYFNTFFYPNIRKSYSQGLNLIFRSICLFQLFQYIVRRWTRKFDLFSYEIVIVPIHLVRSLAAVNRCQLFYVHRETTGAVHV